MTATTSAGINIQDATPEQAWAWPGADRVPAGTPPLRRAKMWALARAEQAGIVRTVRDSRWRSRRLLILAYHGLSLRDEHEWSPELYLPPAALRARFEMIRDNGYRVLPLREAVDRLRSGTLPPRSIALTFDDGMRDFLDVGLPLLKEFGFPATVYVTTYYAEKQAPVFRVACRYLLWVGRDRSVAGDGLTLDGKPLDLHSLDQRDAAFTAIEARLTSLDRGSEEEAATLRRLADRVGTDFDRFLEDRLLRIMTPDEIRSLPSDLVDVQLHTHRHRVPLRKESFDREIEDNRRALATWRPSAALDGFCYPSGVVDLRFLPWLRGLKIRISVTCEVGLATSKTEPLLLPRFVDSATRTRVEFAAWLSGLGSLLPSLPRAGRYKPAPVFE
jgi:peptidoglycan/xylan/chitin deacetylase (PgdA/CDA1 family)